MSGAADFASVGGGIPDTNVSLPSASSVYTLGFGQPAVGVFRLGADGKIYNGASVYGGGVSYSIAGTWCTGTPGDYDVRATALEGTLDAGSAAIGTWLNLGTNRQWSMTDSTANPGDDYGGAAQGSITLEIRKVSALRAAAVGFVSFNVQRYS